MFFSSATPSTPSWWVFFSTRLDHYLPTCVPPTSSYFEPLQFIRSTSPCSCLPPVASPSSFKLLLDRVLDGRRTLALSRSHRSKNKVLVINLIARHQEGPSPSSARLWQRYTLAFRGCRGGEWFRVILNCWVALSSGPLIPSSKVSMP